MAKETSASKVGRPKAPSDADPQPADGDGAPEPQSTPAAPARAKAGKNQGPLIEQTQAFAQDTIQSETPKENAKKPETPVSKGSDSSEGAAVPAEASKGGTILGDYKLLARLGKGGMGEVFKAHQISLDRIVAVKVLAKDLSDKESYVARFEREARIMAKLDHPHILRCHEVNKARGRHYIAMEFVEGGSIEAKLKELKRFSLGDSLHIILKTAEALQHAHEIGLIHRDIKPDNILLTKDGILKVADLGLAKDTTEDQSVTKTGAGAGTPIYMAPEQARDVKHVDARVDIYALGVMMYVFLTGQPPFLGNTLVELTNAKETGKFDPMRKRNPEVPSKLDLIVDKMLAKEAKHRFSSCAEVIAQLEPLGLHHDHLSFFGTPAKTGGAAKRSATATTNAPGQSSAVAKTNISPKGRGQTHAPEEVKESPDVWYWNFTTPAGQLVTKKVTTSQLMMLIKGGHVQQDAQVSKTMKTGFRNAASFQEFSSLFKARQTQSKANTKGQKFQDKMKSIVSADERQRKYGWIGNAFKSMGGVVMGVVWILLVLALVGGGGWFLYWTVLRP